MAYLSTQQLSKHLCCSSRSLFRRMQRAINPLPQPAIRSVGSANLWDAEEIARWEHAERERTKQAARVNTWLRGLTQ